MFLRHVLVGTVITHDPLNPFPGGKKKKVSQAYGRCGAGGRRGWLVEGREGLVDGNSVLPQQKEKRNKEKKKDKKEKKKKKDKHHSQDPPSAPLPPPPGSSSSAMTAHPTNYTLP